MSIYNVIDEVVKIYKPTEEEEENLVKIAENIIREAYEETSTYPRILEISIEGSLAKKTWVKGKEEIDIFVHFDPVVPREEMENRIIEVGFKVLEKIGGKPRLMYAEHPYVESKIDNVIINIVACYRVEPPNWISATDRTPHHTKYIIKKMDQELRNEARIMKAFMIGCNVYGAEIKIRGFSGYLAELLTLKYSGFKNALEAISTWRPPILIDIEGHYSSVDELLSIFPKQPLIVVDPVDKFRNVASAVAEEKLYELILASKLFLRSPSLKFFKPDVKPIRASALKKKAKNRNFTGILFKLSKWRPPDVLWGELRKCEHGVRRTLEKNGFKIYRSASWTDEEKSCLILFELEYNVLSNVEVHQGPPVDHPNSLVFIDKWSKRKEKIAGPWIHGSRLYVLRLKPVVDVKKILKREIENNSISLAKGLAEDIKKGKIITSIEKLVKHEKLTNFLDEFLNSQPPYLR